MLYHVVLPQIGAGLTVLLLCFAEAWNLVEAPTVLLPDTYLRPASTALGDSAVQGGEFSYATAVMYTLPILGMYLLTGWKLREA